MWFRIGTDDFSQFCVEIPEVFRPQLGELVVAQRRKDAFDVLPVTADGGLRQLADALGYEIVWQRKKN